MNKMTAADARLHIMQPKGIINLNAGTCSPVAKPVFNALTSQLEMQSSDPADYIWSTSVPLIESGRRALASFLDCDPDQLLLFTNASYAINTVLRSLPWKKDDEIITTDQEYHHYRTLFNLIQVESGVRITKINLPLTAADENLSATDIRKLFSEKASAATRAIFFSHITSPTGFQLPAKEICHWARINNILTIVDGAHAPGHVPVSIKDIAPDFYTANVHKWIMNPAGCAFLYAAPEVRFRFSPLMCMSGYDLIAEGEDRPTRFGTTGWCFAHEYQGTRNMTPMTVLPDTLNFYNAIGQRSVQTAWESNREHLVGILRNLELDIVSPGTPELRSCMISCRIPVRSGKIDTLEARKFFRYRHNIELAFPSLEDGSSLLRVSAAWFNTKEELNTLAALLSGFDWEVFS